MPKFLTDRDLVVVLSPGTLSRLRLWVGMQEGSEDELSGALDLHSGFLNKEEE